MLRFAGPQNHDKLAALNSDLLKRTTKEIWAIDLNIERYVRITYRDALGFFYTRYFLVNRIFGAREIPEFTGAGLFAEKDLEDAKNADLRFDTLTVDSILALVAAQPLAGPNVKNSSKM